MYKDLGGLLELESGRFQGPMGRKHGCKGCMAVVSRRVS